MIEKFDGEYRFLSNFFYCHITLDGDDYASVEHAYQAAKSTDSNIRGKFQSWNNISPAAAKKLGKTIPLRPDWEEIKQAVMLDLLRQKFKGDDVGLRTLLLATGDEELIEGNWWGDRYWGVCNGKGENHLGKLLMQVRVEIQEGQK